MILKRIRSPTNTQRSLCKSRDFPLKLLTLLWLQLLWQEQYTTIELRMKRRY